MFQNKLLSIIVFVFSLSTTFANKSPIDNTRPESAYDKVFRQGDLANLLSEVPNRLDLQFERLVAYYFHQKINQYRLEKNLYTLYWDDRMWLAARNHNLYLWKLNTLTHEEKTGKPFYSGINPWDRMQYVMYNNFKMESYAENCLYFTDDFYTFEYDDAMEIAERALVQWKNSPGHNKNMLDPKHFAHGTSFIVAGDYLYATTNFGNASDFVENEIAITWNDSLAKLYPPQATAKRKPYLSSTWSVSRAENELFGVVKAIMPKHASAYNPDFTKAAEIGVKNRAGKPLPKKITDTKSRYQKAAAHPDLKIMLRTITEKAYRFEFTKEQLQSKAALKIIDDQVSKDLTVVSKIKNWGGKCILTEKDMGFVCDIVVIFTNN